MDTKKFLALIVTTLLATAAPPVSDPAHAAAEPTTSPVGGVTHRVTLVTGDSVEYTDSGGGRRSVAVRAAPRRDGVPVTFEILGGRDDYFVIPSDTETHLAAGVLDRSLFDVADLVRDGLDDARSDALPVLADYPGRAEITTRASALPGVTRVVPVATTSMAGIAIDHARADDFWTAVAPRPGTHTLGGGIARLTLDRTVRRYWTAACP